MARGINKVILVGTCGKDPETRYMPSGGAVTSISIATNEKWKDKQTGQDQERTEWHNLTFFGRLGEIAGEYLQKGKQIYVEGKLRTESHVKDGVTKYYTKIIVSEMQLLGGGSGSPGPQSGQQHQSQPQGQPHPAPVDDNFDDDIPF